MCSHRIIPPIYSRLAALICGGAVLAVLLGASGAFAQSTTATPPYRNPGLSVDERVKDLLGRMTLEEKIGQIMLWDARGDDLSFINTRHAGAILHILGEKIGRAEDLAAKERLGIPLLVGEDAIHGHSFWKGATIFPTQLAHQWTAAGRSSSCASRGPGSKSPWNGRFSHLRCNQRVPKTVAGYAAARHRRS